MEWHNQIDTDSLIFDAAKERWAKSAAELGNPRFIINDPRGWQAVSLVPQTRAWSYIFDENYSGDPKGATGFLTFGISRQAEYFLVFDEAWRGETRNVVLSYRRVCQCQRIPLRNTINESQPELCRNCGGEHEWTYPQGSSQRRLPPESWPSDWRSLSTTFSIEVLRDPDATDLVLTNAAQKGNVDDRLLVALHPNCPQDLLNGHLAIDSQAEVRAAVGFRAQRGVSQEVIAALCADGDGRVRAMMARHRPQVIGHNARAVFASDVSPLVRTNLALNSDVPDDVVMTMLQDSSSAECKNLREALVRHPAIDANANLGLLTRSFEDLFPNMFYELLARKDLTLETLAEIRSRIRPDDTRLRAIVDGYDTYTGKSRLRDSLIEEGSTMGLRPSAE